MSDMVSTRRTRILNVPVDLVLLDCLQDLLMNTIKDFDIDVKRDTELLEQVSLDRGALNIEQTAGKGLDTQTWATQAHKVEDLQCSHSKCKFGPER